MLGTLLPLSAIGSFAAGEQVLDWLTKTKQNAWQFLPLHQSGWKKKNLFTSPYDGFGIGLNPLFVKLPPELPDDVQFLTDHQDWLPDYALFMALADHFNTANWTSWPKAIAKHQATALRKWRLKLAMRIDYHQKVQAYVFREYQKLRKLAQAKKISLTGDMPFYLKLHSPLVWANQKAFELHEPYVSGVISSGYFPRQVWNLPLYDYRHLGLVKKIWKIRLRFCAELYDWLRMDSAVSFYTYNKINLENPAHDETVQGPGDKILRPLFGFSKKLKLKLFIENVTDYDQGPLRDLAQKYRVPGVAIFALNPEKFVLGHFDQQTLYYSSNHDCPTLVEFTHGRVNAKKTREFLLKNCPRLIVLFQDRQLSNRRINYPGTRESKNWHYKIDLSKLKAP